MPSTALLSTPNCCLPTLLAKSFNIHTYEKRVCNSFNINTYKNKGLKVLYHQHLQKRGGGTPTFDSQLSTLTHESPITSHESRH